jgi:hypothetical protein
MRTDEHEMISHEIADHVKLIDLLHKHREGVLTSAECEASIRLRIKGMPDKAPVTIEGKPKKQISDQQFDNYLFQLRTQGITE